MKEKKIAEVNVDSGNLMITDPLYLSQWQNTEFEDKLENKFPMAMANKRQIIKNLNIQP